MLRSLRRRTYPLRRFWHRAVRPLRRPVRVIVVLAILTIVAVGLYAKAETYNDETVRLEMVAGPDSTVLLGTVDERGTLVLSGLRTGDRILAVDGEAMTVERFRQAPHLVSHGPHGDTLSVRAERDGDIVHAAIIRGGRDIADARSFGLSDRAIGYWLDALYVLMVVSFVACGIVLFVRSRARGYLASLATAMLAAAGATGFVSMLLWDGGDIDRRLAFVIAGTAGAIFVSAVPAVISALVRFPDGRYMPRWTRHVRAIAVGSLAAFIVSAGISSGNPDWLWAIWIGVGVIMATLAMPLVGLWQKYRRAEDGVIRQQMKWVLLPLGAFLLVMLSTLAAEAIPAFDQNEAATGYLFNVGTAILAFLTFSAIPLGVLAGVFRFRPWDADLWIARSAAIGVATLGLAAVFAAGAELIRLSLRSSFGTSADPIAAALAAILSLFAFNPVREWFTKRAESDLERTREILGERLPLILAGRQVVASPAEIGRVAIRDVQEALQTERAAVIDLDPEGWEVVAASGVNREDALAWADATLDARGLPDGPEQVWEDPTFVLRVPLRSAEDELVGVLALGTHGKGRGYSTEERKAIAGMTRPLAEALRVAERREEAEALRTARMAQLEDRFLEAPE